MPAACAINDGIVFLAVVAVTVLCLHYLVVLVYCSCMYLHLKRFLTTFYQMDESVLRKALAVLQSELRVTLFQGATSDEDGVIFF
jgi:hypothetical protein